MRTATTAKTQYAVQFIYADADPETVIVIGRSIALHRAETMATAHRRAIAVERTPTTWQPYLGVLPELSTGETIEWGVARDWRDGHHEDQPSGSRHDAEVSVRFAVDRVDPIASLAFRILPGWRPIGAGPGRTGDLA